MSGSGGVVIRPATPDDHDAIWAILEPVYRAGETYCIPRDVTRAEAIADWFAPPSRGSSRFWTVASWGPAMSARTARPADRMSPTRPLPPIPMRAAVASPAHWSITRNPGPRREFTAMQFNFVVSTNADAVHLWQKAGFAIVGRLPGSFRHPQLGPVDALVMFHTLKGEPDEP